LVIDSDFICSDTQLEAIGDWYLMYGKDPKHGFACHDLPFLAFMQPGAMLDFSLTEMGYSALAEVAGFSHHITPDGSKTELQLVETPSEWNVTSSVVVRQVVAAPDDGTAEGQVGAAATGGNLEYVLGSAGCLLAADLVCDGTDDQSEMNEVIGYLDAVGGGTLRLVGSTFKVTNTVRLYDGIHIIIDAGVTVEKDGDFNLFYAAGTETTHLVDIGITGNGSIDRVDSLHENYLIAFYNVDDMEVSGLRILRPDSYAIDLHDCTGHVEENEIDGLDAVDGSGAIINLYGSGCQVILGRNYIKNFPTNRYGIWATYVEQAIIEDNVITDLGGVSGGGRGIYLGVGADGNVVRRNKVSGCRYSGILIDLGDGNTVGENQCYDNGQLIDHAGCNGGIPHMIVETYTLLNCTASLSSTYSYFEDQSLLLVKTDYASAASAAYFWLGDNTLTTDMHLLNVQQGSYKMQARIMCVTGGVAPGNVHVIFGQYYGAAWHDAVATCPSSISSWALVELEVSMASATMATRFGAKIAATAEKDELAYFGEILLIPVGVGNEHERNFYDGGTNTRLSDNSWQSPVDGEEAWGEKHTRVMDLWAGEDPSTLTTVITADVPKGAKSAFGWAAMLSPTAGHQLQIRDINGVSYAATRNPTTTIAGYLEFDVPLDSSGQFIVYVNNTAVDNVSIYQRGYRM
jgi:parallel beta-helix repeat protein